MPCGRNAGFTWLISGKVHSGVVDAGVPAPMLARLESILPRGPEWRYEPKLDGFRSDRTLERRGSSAGT